MLKLLIEIALILIGAVGSYISITEQKVGFAFLIFCSAGAILILIRNKKLESKNNALTNALIKAVSVSGAPSPLLLQMEEEFRAKGRVMNVLKTYEEVLRIDPNNMEAIEGKLQFLSLKINLRNRERSADTPNVIEEFRAFLMKYQEKVHLFTSNGKLALAVACDGLREFHVSRDLYRSIEDSLQVKQTFAISLLMSGKIEEAHKTIHEALRCEPINSAMLFNLGEIEHAIGHFDLSIEAHRRVGNSLKSRYSYKRISESKFQQMKFLSSLYWNIKFNIMGNSAKDDRLNFIILFKHVIFSSPFIYLSRFVHFVPFLNSFYAFEMKPSKIHMDIMGNQLKEFPDAFRNAAIIAEHAYKIDSNPVNFLNHINLLSKIGRKEEAVKLVKLQIEYAEGGWKKHLVGQLEYLESKSKEELESRKVNMQSINKSEII